MCCRGMLEPQRVRRRPCCSRRRYGPMVPSCRCCRASSIVLSCVRRASEREGRSGREEMTAVFAMMTAVCVPGPLTC